MTTLEEVTTVPKKFELPHPSELENESRGEDRLYTIPDLVEFLLNVPTRASFVTFRSRTTPRMRKTGNHIGTEIIESGISEKSQLSTES